MNKNIDRIIDVAAYVVGTALDISDQAKEYVPSILHMLANLASTLATLATALASCVALAYDALKPVFLAQIRAISRVSRQGCILLKANAPLLLNRLYEALRAHRDLVKNSHRLVKEQVKEQAKEQVKKIKDYAIAAWQFRKECLA